MRYHQGLVSLLLMAVVCSCRINRVVNDERQGKWIYTTDVVASEIKKLGDKGVAMPQELAIEGYYYKGRYRKGKEVGKWKYFMNGKLVRKEKYRGAMALVRFFHPNGKVESEGKTYFDTSASSAHWYYDGEWKFFSDNGQLLSTRVYKEGELISEKQYGKHMKNGN